MRHEVKDTRAVHCVSNLDADRCVSVVEHPKRRLLPVAESTSSLTDTDTPPQSNDDDPRDPNDA